MFYYMRHPTWWRGALCAVGALLLGAVAAQGQDTIPPGTKVTRANWQRYQRFMPDGMQELFRRQPPWAIPADAQIGVAQTVPIVLPKLFREDTERYSSQVRLVQNPEGGFTTQGYVAGVPFPHPNGPNAGEEVLYDRYWVSGYVPWLTMANFNDSRTVDRYLSVFDEMVLLIFRKMKHVTGQGLPQELPGTGPYFQASYSELLAPEQIRYLGSLVLKLDDPAAFEELYVFLPSLRRTLRLSAAAVCAPQGGTDYTVEDENGGFFGQPPGFKVRFLGEQKILSLMHPDSQQLRNWANFSLPTFWPKPAIGNWELRNVYKIELTRLPGSRWGGGSWYCYGKRVLYIDKDVYDIRWEDLYDRNGKLWKVGYNMYVPDPVPDQGPGYMTTPDHGTNIMIDLQNLHASGSIITDTSYDNEVPAKYQDVNRYGLPGGLDQIMK